MDEKKKSKCGTVGCENSAEWVVNWPGHLINMCPPCLRVAESIAKAMGFDLGSVAIASECRHWSACPHVTKKYADAISRIESQRSELRRTIQFFSSVIKSGEPWTEACEEALREAMR